MKVDELRKLLAKRDGYNLQGDPFERSQWLLLNRVYEHALRSAAPQLLAVVDAAQEACDSYFNSRTAVFCTEADDRALGTRQLMALNKTLNALKGGNDG